MVIFVKFIFFITIIYLDNENLIRQLVSFQFAMVECVITGLSDEYPKYLRKYKWLFLILACVVMFLLALPQCMQVSEKPCVFKGWIV